ncbi:MAG: hypothetical protein ACI4P3_01230, partial [Candidatus Spyradosoma sp.]
MPLPRIPSPRRRRTGARLYGGDSLRPRVFFKIDGGAGTWENPANMGTPNIASNKSVVPKKFLGLFIMLVSCFA